VCGFPAYVREGSVVLERVRGTTQTMSFSTGSAVAFGLSVAPGGRRLASNLFFPGGANGVFEFDHQGTVLAGPIPGMTERHYLERDTVDVRRGPSDLVAVQRTGPSGTVSYSLQAVIGSNIESPTDIAFSPDGAWAATVVERLYTGNDSVHLSLIPFANPSEVRVGGFELLSGCQVGCPAFAANEIGWSNDSRRVVVATFEVERLDDVDIFDTKLWNVLVGPPLNVQNPPLITDIKAVAPRFSPNDSTIVWDQVTSPTQCQPALRLASNFSLVTAGAPRTLCADAFPPGMFFSPPGIAGPPSLPPAFRALLERQSGPRPPLRRVTQRQ